MEFCFFPRGKRRGVESRQANGQMNTNRNDLKRGAFHNKNDHWTCRPRNPWQKAFRPDFGHKKVRCPGAQQGHLAISPYVFYATSFPTSAFAEARSSTLYCSSALYCSSTLYWVNLKRSSCFRALYPWIQRLRLRCGLLLKVC